MNPETRTCQNCKQDFTIEPDDFAFYEKIKVPAPTWCWRCRAMRRMQFYNMRYLYSRICVATGKKIFTSLPPDSPIPPYDYDYWVSDAWDAMEYGRDYDFSKPFFEQIRELFHVVPWNLQWGPSVNSDYGLTGYSKNCYLCFDSGYLEDSAYSVTLHDSKQCIDMVNCQYCELCYYCINSNNCYKTYFSRECTACTDVWLSEDCTGCMNCFGCVGLRRKSYHIFNEPYSKEAYVAKLEELQIGTWAGFLRAKEHFSQLRREHPVKYRHSVQTKDCTGDYIYNAAELSNCFFAGNAQNCTNCQSIIYGPIKDSMDLTSSGPHAELDYETIGCGPNVSRLRFSFYLMSTTDSEYSIGCTQSSDLFGCVGVRSKKYCILNKQYSKEEYEVLVAKIKQHMADMPYVDAKGRVYTYGEFFPTDMSPWGYNETQAQEYFPLEHSDIETQGFRWREFEKRVYSVTKKASELPERIDKVGDEILGEIIQCMHEEKNDHPWGCAPSCSTAFRLTREELQFYRQTHLPLPRYCFNCRHLERVTWRNKPHLWARKCMCAGVKSGVYQNITAHFHGENPCPNEFETSYASERPEIVYCEQCYNAEVA
jgi:hypothetical protein